MSELLPRVGARVIRATTALDRAYTLLDRVRSRLSGGRKLFNVALEPNNDRLRFG